MALYLLAKRNLTARTTMENQVLCKHGCGTNVSSDAAVCPNCGGPRPYPDSTPRETAGLLEKGCLIIMIFGGLLGGIALLVTKLVVG